MDTNSLGAYLKDRRTKLDPAALGLPLTRRRTAGLRREEVAQRANVSATWYTWLEQGRGGAPSPMVLDRIAQALILTEAEREHVHLLAFGRPPEVHVKAIDGITPRLQGVLNGLVKCPAFVRTFTWDVVAWNDAASAVLIDHNVLSVAQGNVLRMMFLSPEWQSHFKDWKLVARSALAMFRAEVVKSGATDAASALVEDLSRRSDVFREMWSDNDVLPPGEATKEMLHPIVGLITMELSSFSVDSRPDLRLLVYSPSGHADAQKIEHLIAIYEKKKLETANT